MKPVIFRIVVFFCQTARQRLLQRLFVHVKTDITLKCPDRDRVPDLESEINTDIDRLLENEIDRDGGQEAIPRLMKEVRNFLVVVCFFFF